ncbi:MAG: hypothetical protein LBN33_08410 [Desulfovibrio sp.]|jgi:hypothetical protein|nr:hypothetical protein [Desulfovibrio sp.]
MATVKSIMEILLLASTDPFVSSSGSGRVNRGGGWSSNAEYCSSVCRRNYRPGYRNYFIGFRLASPQSDRREKVGAPERNGA